MYWPHPNVDLNVRMCVAECPEDTGRKICLYQRDGETLHIADKFCYTAIQTTRYGRYCVPRESETKVTVDEWIVSWENVYRRALGDLAMSKDIIFVGFIAAMIVGFLVTVMMSFKILATIWIWLSMMITLLCFGVIAGFSYLEYKDTIAVRCYNAVDTNQCGGERASFFWLLMWIFGIIGAAYLCGILFYFRKLQLTTRIYRKSTFLYRRTWQMKSVIGMGVLAIVIITFFFLFTMITASSNGPNVLEDANIADGKYLRFSPNTIHRILLWLDLPMVYMAYTFVICVAEMLAAFSVSRWYFSRKKREAVLPTTMVMQTALFNHTGTACKLTVLKWGLKPIRNLAWFIKKRLRSGNQDRNWTRFAIATFLPLLTWYEKKLKFISKDSLFNTCMWGDEFNIASKKGYFLAKLRHKTEGYSVMNYIKFILFSSKCAISIMAGMFVYMWCTTQKTSPSQFDITIMDTPMVPYLFTFFTSLFLSSIFFIPFDMTIRGVLQCYAIDSEMFVGDQRYTEPYLQKYFDDLQQMTMMIEKDYSFCCFGCICRKKKGHQKVGTFDANVVFDEEDDRKFYHFYSHFD